jgi:hypothetical protein
MAFGADSMESRSSVHWGRMRLTTVGGEDAAGAKPAQAPARGRGEDLAACLAGAWAGTDCAAFRAASYRGGLCSGGGGGLGFSFGCGGGAAEPVGWCCCAAGGGGGAWRSLLGVVFPVLRLW